jgi:hypothetical protein
MGPAEPVMPTSTPKSFAIPKLSQDGSNWVTWKSQTLATLTLTRGAQRHLDGTARIPPAIPTYPDGHTLTDEEEEKLDNLERHWNDYNQRESTIKAQIYTMIPDSPHRNLEAGHREGGMGYRVHEAQDKGTHCQCRHALSDVRVEM